MTPDEVARTEEEPGGAGSAGSAPPAAVKAVPASAAPDEAVAAPHPASALRALFSHPLRALHVVLSEQDRLARTIAQGEHGTLLVGGLLYLTILFSLPFGAVIGLERFWRVALLFVGSLGICLPSLQVFSAYVGCRISVRQNLALGLVITCVAALFTFGFFPIVWFLDATMEAAPAVATAADTEPARVTISHLALLLLTFSLTAGIVHLIRCLRRFHGLVAAYPLVMVFWQALFIFITYRMARLLDLLPWSAP